MLCSLTAAAAAAFAAAAGMADSRCLRSLSPVPVPYTDSRRVDRFTRGLLASACISGNRPPRDTYLHNKPPPLPPTPWRLLCCLYVAVIATSQQPDFGKSTVAHRYNGCQFHARTVEYRRVARRVAKPNRIFVAKGPGYEFIALQ